MSRRHGHPSWLPPDTHISISGVVQSQRALWKPSFHNPLWSLAKVSELQPCESQEQPEFWVGGMVKQVGWTTSGV